MKCRNNESEYATIANIYYAFDSFRNSIGEACPKDDSGLENYLNGKRATWP